MNTAQIRQIEDCFSNTPVNLDNLVRATEQEHVDFLQLLQDYKQEAHVALFWNLSNSGYFDSACPF